MTDKEIQKIFNEDFGYTKITVERPLRDENGELLLKKGKKQPDTALRDTENVPLTENIEDYFKREVLPFASDAWIDEKKSKVGYEIPFTRYFYKYEAPRPSVEIMKEIMELEQLIDERYKKIDKAELLLDQLKEQQRQLHEAHTFQCMKLNRLATEFSDSAIASKYCDGMHQMVDGAEYKEIHQSIDRGMITLKQKMVQ